MITIGKAHMDFHMRKESFAYDLYGRWEGFSRTSVEEVIDHVLSRYDSSDEVIRLESLVLDLGTVSESDFYEDFPRLLAEKLAETFSDCLRHRGSFPIEVIPVHENRIEVLLFYLLHGFWPENESVEYRDISGLLRMVTENHGSQLIGRLRETASSFVVRERLVLQFTDEELGWIVAVAEPSEKTFITAYVRFLIVSHRRLERPEVTYRDYRNVVWQVVFAYLLFEGRSYFSRKQMVWQTIRELAAHFNLDINYLLQLLMSGLEKFTEEWIHVPELLMIFSDIRAGMTQETMENKAVVALLASKGSCTANDYEMLRRLLSHSDTCRRVLYPLKEEEIIRLVEIVLPSESGFVVSYAQGLEREKERGLLEGKAGTEFRILKWEFIFLVLLQFPKDSFQRKRFVWEVICRMAAHYNMGEWELLTFLYADTDYLFEQLKRVLDELYHEQMDELNRETGKTPVSREYSKEETMKLIRILSHSLSARKFLSVLSEERIYSLVEVIIPAESIFIVSYAQELQREKERGILEGKAGTEFRILKWEFIFVVVLSAPVSSFERKQFVLSVLRQMSAHYNLPTGRLLDYFHALIERESVLPMGLASIISVLWEEEKLAEGKKLVNDDEAQFVEVFGILMARTTIAKEEWQKIGFPFTLKLLVRYERHEVLAFIRKYKMEFWNMLFQSREQVRLVYDKIGRTDGLLAFLVAEYGKTALITVLDKAGIPGRHLMGCTLSDWKDMCVVGDVGTQLWWLKNSPEKIREVWQLCSGMEETRFLEGLSESEELQLEWLRKVGSVALRQVVDRIIELQKSFFSFPSLKTWHAWLLPYTRKQYANLSFREILSFFWQKLTAYLPENEQKGMEKMILEDEIKFKDIKQLLMEKRNMAKPFDRKEQEKNGDWAIPSEDNKAFRFFIENAGMVLLAPYIPRLFSILKYVEQGKFVSDEMQLRAVFLLQHLLSGEEEFAEPDLILNKLLVGCDISQPLPRRMELTEQEREMVKSMLDGVMSNWDKMKNTSLEGFRQSFLMRAGCLEESDDLWQLAVEERAYDVLLSTLPWSYSPIKLPWMAKPIYVNWRN